MIQPPALPIRTFADGAGLEASAKGAGKDPVASSRDTVESIDRDARAAASSVALSRPTGD